MRVGRIVLCCLVCADGRFPHVVLSFVRFHGYVNGFCRSWVKFCEIFQARNPDVSKNVNTTRARISDDSYK